MTTKFEKKKFCFMLECQILVGRLFQIFCSFSEYLNLIEARIWTNFGKPK